MILRNDQTVQQLASEFQLTNDASFAHESLASSYLALPGLRGFWPLGAIDASGGAIDVSGAGRLLTGVNTPLLLAQAVPNIWFQSAASEVLYRADEAALDIIGNEAYVHTPYQGLTMGMWVSFTVVDQSQGLMGKYAVSGVDGSYLLYMDGASNVIRFIVTNDGTAQVLVNHTADPVTSKWYFVVGRFDPSTELKIWVNDVAVVNTTSIPATLWNSGASFTIGSYGTFGVSFTSYLDAKASCAFLCAAYLPDNIIRRLYYRTRPAFQSRQDW